MTSKSKQLIVLIIAIILGVLFQYANLLYAAFFSILVLVLIFVTLAFLTIAFLQKKFRAWYLLPLVPLLVAYIYSTSIQEYRHSKALKIIYAIEKYKYAHGIYPSDLTKIDDESELGSLNYYLNRNLKAYTLTYQRDGSFSKCYQSDTKSWTTLR